MVTEVASAELRGDLIASELLFVIQEVEGSNPAYLVNIYVAFSSRFIVPISSDVTFSVHIASFLSLSFLLKLVKCAGGGALR
jgi:hypothetical protein